MLTNTFLNRTRTRWLRWLVKFQYKAGNVWYTAEITKKEIVNNLLRITTMTTDDEALTVTAVRVYDDNGDLVLETSENITKKATQGILTVWEFPLTEV